MTRSSDGSKRKQKQVTDRQWPVCAGRARELALTARTITADTALAYGLVTEVVSGHGVTGKDQLDARAGELATEIASKSTLAAAGTKRVMVWGMGKPVADGLEYVTAHNAAVMYSRDLQVSYFSCILMILSLDAVCTLVMVRVTLCRVCM